MIFYCPASNDETGGARAIFEVASINSPDGINDNTDGANRIRDAAYYAAKHGAEKSAYTDTIGRIGNLVIEDTGDWRYSNLFKMPVPGNSPENWRVQGIVKNVDSNSKNFVLAGTKDIRGLTAKAPYGQDIYGLLSWLRDKTLTFPLTPAKNNIQALKEEPLRVGYHTYLDITTLGKNYTNIEVLPAYYYYELDTRTVTPLDVYINANTGYEPINLFGNYDLNRVYQYTMSLNWTEQAKRRNVTESEQNLTVSLSGLLETKMPEGEYYILGNAQGLTFDERARTYIGSGQTLGALQNIGGLIPESEFQQSVKRWHFELGLPSSAVFVDSGAAPTEVNIAKYKKSGGGSGVILLSAEIWAQGGLYKLAYDNDGDGVFQIGNASYPLPAGLTNVIAVYNGDGKTSRNDVEIRKTH